LSSSNTLQKAVFIDRDGVINKEVNYLYKIEDFEFIDGVIDACKQYQDAGFALIIITNQAGIGRGYYTEAQFQELTDWMLKAFAGKGVNITHVYFCPHHQKEGLPPYNIDCECRKPKPGMILQAQKDHGINLSESILFGDKVSDVQAGINAGIGVNVLVESGHEFTQDDAKLAHKVMPTLQFMLPETLKKSD